MLPLIEALADGTHLYLVFPYADGGELFEVCICPSLGAFLDGGVCTTAASTGPAFQRSQRLNEPFSDKQTNPQTVAARPTGLSEPEARRYFGQIVSGLQHLQRHGLAHGWVGGWIVYVGGDGWMNE